MSIRFLIAGIGILSSGALYRTADAQEGTYGAIARVRAESLLGTTSLSAEQAAQRPGALGEPGRALFDAPGAARSGFLGSELILWGAAPSETQTYVDGVQIPNLFHPAGLRTTVHPALIERVTVTPGALSADYGRGIGGAVDLETKTVRPGYRGQARADGIDSSLSLEAGNQTVQSLLGLRYGYFDRVLSRLAPNSQGVLAAPSHEDGVARLAVRTDPRTQLSATWLGARDHVDVHTDDGRQDRTNDFHVGSLRLDRRYDDGARMRITPFVGFSSSREASTFGGAPLSLGRRGYSYGLRAEYARTLGFLTLRIGLDARGTRDHVTRQGTLSLPAREGDVRVFGQVPIGGLDRDAYRVSSLNVAPWTAVTLRLRRLFVTPSVRLETYAVSVSRLLPQVPTVPAVGRDALTLYPEPRLAVSYRALAWLQLEARTGLHHQAADPSDLSATFGTPGLSAARALQSSLSARFTLPRELNLELVAFDKELQALAARTTNSPARTAQELTATGHGSARGGSLALRGDLTPALFVSAAYTLSHSLRSDPNGKLRLFDYDQTHVLSTVLGFTGAGFVVSARVRAATGAPRSRVIGSYLDSKSGLAEPLFGPHNRTRLPGYFSLDLHAEYGVAIAKTRLAVFFDVLNATDRNNVEDFAYAANYSQRRNVRSIPIVAMAGASLRFGDE